MSEPVVVEDFFGVYLLYNINPRFKGRTYIGYTRDPARRVMQHNRGIWAGGAHRTNNRGPWDMVMIIHGFPNNISALRFEWAWQNPTKTIRLQHLNLKKIPRKETEYQFKLRVLSEMLKTGPWCRLPLTVRWLMEKYEEEFAPERRPPDHMPICSGRVKSKNLKKNKDHDNTSINCTECLLCSNNIINKDEKIKCLNNECELVAHLTCLADLFLPSNEIIPIEGTCPFCDMKLKWGDLIRKMKGCNDCNENDCDSDSISDADENNDGIMFSDADIDEDL